MRIRIRIQQLKLMRIHADPDTDPDPKPWFILKQIPTISALATTVLFDYLLLFIIFYGRLNVFRFVPLLVDSAKRHFVEGKKVGCIPLLLYKRFPR